ncbi:MAG: hypothetical protein ACE5FU_15060, partial [Nitrospinota bacterium]
ILAIIWLTFSAFPTTAEAQRSPVEVWSQTCGKCHQSQPASRYTVRKWESIATHMKIHARLTDEESDSVLEFLKEGAKDAVTAIPPATNSTLAATSDADNSNYPLTEPEIKAIKEFIQKVEKKDSEKGNDKKE